MKKNVSEILKNKGLRLTDVRKAVLQLLLNSGNPLSHQDIISKKTILGFDRVTVYRTLETFQKSHLIHKIKGTDGVSRFGANLEKLSEKCSGDHIHFHCSVCNKMTCLPEQPLPWIKAPKGFEIHSKQLVVYGTCSKCARG